MAIKNNFEKFGTTFTDAYHRISSLSYNVSDLQENVMITEPTVDEDGVPVPAQYEMQWKKKATANGEVTSYASQVAREAHSEAFARTYFSFTVDLEGSDNWMEQAYTHIKTLDAFAGSVDVL